MDYFYRRDHCSDIRNGRAWTENDERTADNVDPETREFIIAWIKENIQPRATRLPISSYSLKHYLQGDTGIYLTNNQFKDFMLICGFRPVNRHWLNWDFRISRKSPIFKKQRTP